MAGDSKGDPGFTTHMAVTCSNMHSHDRAHAVCPQSAPKTKMAGKAPVAAAEEENEDELLARLANLKA